MRISRPTDVVLGRTDRLICAAESPTDPDVHALLMRHHALMRSLSPEESCHVMTPDRLVDDHVTLLGIRRDGTLLAIGGLLILDDRAAELKSMHTAAEARGQGLARLILLALIAHARACQIARVSLETGSAIAFDPARNLYVSEGFTECAPFGAYAADPLSVFMTRTV